MTHSQHTYAQRNRTNAAIVQADPEVHGSAIRDLFTEYLRWGNAGLLENYGVQMDIEALLAGNMGHLDEFMPPAGRLLLAYVDGQPAGIACLRRLEDAIGEVKRMYVRPAYRRQGVGRTLLENLLSAAEQSGYTRVRLDSPRFMTAAHALYRSAGFREVTPYAGSEIPKDLQEHWLFMERGKG